MTTKEYSKLQVLDITKLGNMPPILDANDKRTWTKAIGLVKKRNGCENYVLLENNGNVKIKQDFGTIAMIAEILEIRPYDFVSPQVKPRLQCDADIIKFLKLHKYDESIIAALLSREGKSQEQIEKDHAIVKGYVTAVTIKLDNEEKEEYARVQRIAKSRITYQEAKETKNGRKRKKDTD